MDRPIDFSQKYFLIISSTQITPSNPTKGSRPTKPIICQTPVFQITMTSMALKATPKARLRLKAKTFIWANRWRVPVEMAETPQIVQPIRRMGHFPTTRELESFCTNQRLTKGWNSDEKMEHAHRLVVEDLTTFDGFVNERRTPSETNEKPFGKKSRKSGSRPHP